MALPIIDITTNNTIYGPPQNGELVYEYRPFRNLKTTPTGGVNPQDNFDLGDLTVSSDSAKIDINNPIDIDIEPAYDGSANLLINDRKNPLKLVNSRFYLIDSNHYEIADRRGNLDTNIYTEENFTVESSLIKSVQSIIGLDYVGLYEGGKLPVGNYTFYFKLADADGNESDFISESAKVICHIGTPNDPTSIRGGLNEEDSGKLVKFRLNNLDLAYDYIKVYYTRDSGDDKQELIRAYKIEDKFKIDALNTEVAITGFENTSEIALSEINIQYTTFDSVKSVETCQNIAFAGNIDNNYDLFDTLEKYSLFVTPEISMEETIGNVNSKYKEIYDQDTGNEYFNTKNIYYKLGYWDEEIYRFGIVYILNDYTLSPVFNIRGISELTDSSSFTTITNLYDEINISEDYLLEDSMDSTYPENSKGIFKINTDTAIFSGTYKIKPVGLKFNFQSDSNANSILDGIPAKGIKGLKDLTKGFFIVRQKRIPTILAQGVSIGTTNNGNIPTIKGTHRDYDDALRITQLGESFIKLEIEDPLDVGYSADKVILGRSIFPLVDLVAPYTIGVTDNALLCPEAELRPYVFNNLFNDSEFFLKSSKYNSSETFNDLSADHDMIKFYLGDLILDNSYKQELNSKLLLIEPGIDIIKNNTYNFSSRAGYPDVASKHKDLRYGNDVFNNSTDSDTTLSRSIYKVRGDYNTYLGTNQEGLGYGRYYNIFQKGYDFDNEWKNYFKVRYNDFSAFMPVSDRIDWNNITDVTPAVYRGDCYINTFSHRMNWSFIDPELPTNDKIVDPYTWRKNYRVKTSELAIKSSDASIILDNTSGDIDTTTGSDTIEYKKELDLFTYKLTDTSDVSDATKPFDTLVLNVLPTLSKSSNIVLPDSRGYEKYSKLNGTYGASKMNRPDINAVSTGHWAIFKVCSNVNLSFRDTDFSRPAEEAQFGEKRSFYPYKEATYENKLPDSNILNRGISKTLGNKYYYEIPDVPFIKTNFSTRIYHSELLQDSAFTNGNRVFKTKNYMDYSMEFGALVKLVEWYGTLVAIMEHGILQIPVNERAMMTNASGENVYINAETVLPKNPKVISNTFGSVWTDSVIKTDKFIYGIDTIAKKIWRTNGEQFETISDMSVQKFLNDNINLKSSDRSTTIGESYVKSHYNAFKHDVMFTFKYGTTKWHLCWNELIGKWVTQYTWFPEFSENINNIFYTFADSSEHTNASNKLYKHGFAGVSEEEGTILSTQWYDDDDPHPFEFEFVVIGVQGVQKIFDNFKIVSNLAPPNSFYYEIVGEGYDWAEQKDDFYAFTTDLEFETYLTANPTVAKIPYIKSNPDFVGDESRDPTLRYDVTIKEHNKTKEKLVDTYQKGIDIKSTGRLRGNMRYVEDSWDVQIQPVAFKYAYLDEGVLTFTNLSEMKVRDKYIKIRVVYDGSRYAIVNAIKTFFTISYA